MTLNDFDGHEYTLTGVDTGQIATTGSYGAEHANTITFELDGACYQAIENPEDGYRSSMREIAVLSPGCKVTNRFPGVRVRAVMAEESGRDTVIFQVVESGASVLEIGTGRTDDYYPSFVAHFQPANLPDNSPEAMARREQERREREEAAAREHDERTRMYAHREEHGWGMF